MALTKKQKTLLEAIIASSQSAEGFEYYSTKAVQALIDAGYVEQNPDESTFNQAGEKQTRASQAGIQAMSEVQNQGEQTAAPAPKKSFAIADAVALPQTQRAGRSGNETYPFEQLQVGQSFFVPDSAVKSGTASKSLASTVTAANDRFAENDPSGATRVNRKGATVPVRIPSRKFEVRAVPDGAAWGAEYAGVKGAGVWRTL